MTIEEIIEKVRIENQITDEFDSDKVLWNNCVDYICDKLNKECIEEVADAP